MTYTYNSCSSRVYCDGQDWFHLMVAVVVPSWYNYPFISTFPCHLRLCSVHLLTCCLSLATSLATTCIALCQMINIYISNTPTQAWQSCQTLSLFLWNSKLSYGSAFVMILATCLLPGIYLISTCPFLIRSLKNCISISICFVLHGRQDFQPRQWHFYYHTKSQS